MKTFAYLAAISLAGCFGIFAQSTGMPGPPPRPPGGFMTHSPIGAPGWRNGKVVTGAPYTADSNDSVLQTLSDGNTISRTTTGHVARDSQGRTYVVEDLADGPWGRAKPATITFISDPVAGYTYVLNPSTKIAVRREFRPRNAERVAPHPPEGPAAEPWDAGERVESDLGQQLINGVTAKGKSVTRTIAAGAIGNAQPIVEKTETWTSPDLQVVVLSKRSDPRIGQMTYALSNIQRTEPNTALFQVPSDYTIQDAPRRGEREPR